MSAKAGLLVHKTRAHAAEYLGVKDDSRIIFTSGCTHALNLAILGSVRVGGHVITTVYEHNSVLRPLFELQRAGKISVTTLCPNGCGAVSLEQIERAVRGNTYLIATNHISNVTGAETDVKSIGEFAREKGILYLVDGAQSVGYGGVSLNGICADMMAVAPHKGLHAPQGVGILALSDRAELNPVFSAARERRAKAYISRVNCPKVWSRERFLRLRLRGLIPRCFGRRKTANR